MSVEENSSNLGSHPVWIRSSTSAQGAAHKLSVRTLGVLTDSLSSAFATSEGGNIDRIGCEEQEARSFAPIGSKGTLIDDDHINVMPSLELNKERQGPHVRANRVFHTEWHVVLQKHLHEFDSGLDLLVTCLERNMVLRTQGFSRAGHAPRLCCAANDRNQIPDLTPGRAGRTDTRGHNSAACQVSPDNSVVSLQTKVMSRIDFCVPKLCWHPVNFTCFTVTSAAAEEVGKVAAQFAACI